MPRQNNPQDITGQPGSYEASGQPEGYGQYDMGTSGPPISELDISKPTLRWITVEHPQQLEPISEQDEILNSVYNGQFNVWEVLVLINPSDDSSGDSS